HTISSLKTSPFPPLYYFLMNYWVKVFGYSETVLRFPSLLFSTFSLVAIFYLARGLFNESIGLIASFLLALSPYAINYAQEAKPYSMAWFFSILTFYYFINFIKSGRKSYLFYYTLTSILSIYTFYIGFLFLLVQNIIFFIYPFRKKPVPWLIAQVIIIFSFLPWLMVVQHINNITRGIKWINQTTSYLGTLTKTFRMVCGDFNHCASHLLTHLGIALFISLLLVSLIYFCLSVFKPYCLKPRCSGFINKREFGIVFLWWLLPVLFYFLIDKIYTPIFIPRYLGYSHIPIILLVSVGITLMNFYLRTAKYLILGSLSFIILYGYLLPYYKNGLKICYEDWRGIFRELCPRIGENSLIIADPAYYVASPLQYYGKCLRGDIASFSTYAIKPEHKSVFLVLRGRKEEVAFREHFRHNYIREELWRGGIGFYEYQLKPLSRGEVERRFIQTLDRQITPNNLILISRVSPSLFRFLTTNGLLIMDFDKYQKMKKYHPCLPSSIFIVYRGYFNKISLRGYFLKEKYFIQYGGVSYLGYFWYKKIR
ncbi:MAG: glycosyltransferase family 39 protein, partial [Desulfobacterota bacterium]|nr:glycosyltransferase family 39 protein [Thermodesulfobacteriota bacterium]